MKLKEYEEIHRLQIASFDARLQDALEHINSDKTRAQNENCCIEQSLTMQEDELRELRTVYYELLKVVVEREEKLLTLENQLKAQKEEHAIEQLNFEQHKKDILCELAEQTAFVYDILQGSQHRSKRNIAELDGKGSYSEVRIFTIFYTKFL